MPGFVGATKGSTTERGYGWTQHIKPRRAAFAALPEHSPCARCGRSMWKWAKAKPDSLGRIRSALHYDHNDVRDGYLGFSHKNCNLKAGASEGGKAATGSGRSGMRTCACGATFRMYHPNQSRCADCRRRNGRSSTQWVEPAQRACADCGAALSQPVRNRLRCIACARHAQRRQIRAWMRTNHRAVPIRRVAVGQRQSRLW